MDVTSQAVENLVTQFSSALDFYRELVQNSIDAGSGAIEIWLDFLPDEAGGTGGVIEIHVDDAGEGMNEAVIDEQLTTLFSSSKEHDQTKIGKFGIGFVSVFALNPKGVLVQTGRGGEYWEVFFDADRSYFKSRLQTPVEGTQITLFIEGDRARYTELVARSLTTIDHWCRHSEAEINFEDRASVGGESVQINKPFAVSGECLTAVEREGAHMVLAYSASPVWGFYNKGLALAVVSGKTDMVPPALAHVAFRIKSRYLEHTLSRETVMRDENYDKAMAWLVAAASGPLRARLFEEIGALVAASTAGRRWTASERTRYFELMGYLALDGPDALEGRGGLPIFLGLDGRAYSINQLCARAAADGRVYVECEASSLVEQLIAQGTPVILVESLSGRGRVAGGTLDPVSRVLANGLAREFFTSRVLTRMLDKLRGEPGPGPWAQAAEMITRPVDVLVGVELVTDQPAAAALVARAWTILARGLGPAPGLLSRAVTRLRGLEQRISYGALVPARLQGRPGTSLPLFVVAHEIAPLMAIPTEDRMLNHRTERPEAAVNCEHSQFRALLRLAGQGHDSGDAQDMHDIAAYCLAKALLLDADRGLSLDPLLIGAALETRSAS
ncbi:sacsin N-terminal ATP-binding-like domain-containing protein [Enhygromyxa salina]|uniref:Heat shock protein 90 n=1 Tax=Enhygromyxa salina TaxID=215803 RepID=A0A2S9YWA2_9BACT|nr:ATP-binding protein [Enhygromyxa salina]PRQ09364.1 heat shock protein 90 [Enhygromyxa salina]